MKRTLAACFLAALALPAAAADPPADPHALAGSTIAFSDSYRRLNIFPERLTYDLSWGLIGAGQATLEVSELVEFSSRPAYHVVSRARSNGFFDKFYKVRDINESWIDARTLSSLAYAKTLREGRFVRDEWVVYHADTERFEARWVGRDGNYSVKNGTIPASVQDILSSMYYVRSHDLVPGSDVVLDVNTKENWPLVIRVLRREKVKTPAGTFNTLVIEPAMRHEGIFIQKGKKLQIWLTDDDKKIPVLMKVEIMVGHITAKLSKML